MRDYEAMVIVDAALEEGDIQKAVDRFSGVITDAGGKVTKVDRWGVRRFAYEINHMKEGYYFVAQFSAEPETVSQLDRLFLISDEFVRGKVTLPVPATK
ncbi:MAG: 30S ribosomal protein S6 [Actinobacteria bacterium]|jgi:small subunit ribosomal protein S6|nr:30S ribosomal protein S6 [Actinomycetota bacterium]